LLAAVACADRLPKCWLRIPPVHPGAAESLRACVLR
jgi:hypothetical protein